MTGGRFGSTTTAFRFGIRRDGWTCARSGPEDRSSRSDATRRVAGLPLLQLNPESENLWAIPIHLLARQMVHARVQYIGQPLPPVLWVWGAHERIAVHRPPRSHLPRLTAGPVRCLGPWYMMGLQSSRGLRVMPDASGRLFANPGSPMEGSYYVYTFKDRQIRG
jgi:hypothetical protein